VFKSVGSNSAATTINVNSLGTKNLFFNKAACVGGEILTNDLVEAVYDGTQFQIIGLDTTIASSLLTATGDMIYRNSGGVPTRLAIGSSTNQLVVSGGIPAWTAASAVPSGSSQAQMESASDTTTFVSPGRVQNHPGVAKAWVMLTGSTGATVVSYNSTSTSRSTTGTYTWTINTNFSSANWCLIALPADDTATVLQALVTSRTASAVTVEVRSDGGPLVDPLTLNLVAFGDQ